MGKERRALVKGLMRRLIEHLPEIEFLDRPDSRAHRRAEVLAFRDDLASEVLNPDWTPTPRGG